MESKYINKRRRFIGKIVSPSLNKLENEFIKDGGSYKKYKIEELFVSENGDFDIQKKHINNKGYCVISSGEQNMGIIGKTDISSKIIDKNTITIDMFGNAYYRDFPYKMVTHARVQALSGNIIKNYKIGLYLVTQMTYFRRYFSYNNMATWNKIKDLEIILPVNKEGIIDNNFMEVYISELQKEHIKLLEQEREKQLNKYLSITELKDCELTEDEKDILNNSRNIKYKDFELQELFISDTGDVDLQQKDVNNKGYYFINSGVENCGIKGKTDRKAKIFNENTITIDFWGNAYYRSFKYKMATHNHVFSLCGDIIKNEKVGLYIVSKMSYIKKYFSYNNMGTWNKMKNLTISLPVNNLEEIDFDYMEKYITIIQKIIIKEKNLIKDKFISNTKKVIL